MLGERTLVQPKTRKRIVDALLELTAERPWNDVTLVALARAGRHEPVGAARRL